MSCIDYSGGYPQMRSPLPQHTLQRCREIMFKLGFYPESGSVSGFGKTQNSPQNDAQEIQAELDRAHREKIAKMLGVSPSEVPDFPEDAPGTTRLGTGARPSRYDPQPLGFLTRHFIRRQGWQRPLDVVEVINHWADYVGPEVANHTRVESFEVGKLTIRTDSTAWATQLKWLIPQVEKRLAQRLGAGVVKQVIIRGPLVPSWKHGRLSVPGRGPRDTYG